MIRTLSAVFYAPGLQGAVKFKKSSAIQQITYTFTSQPEWQVGAFILSDDSSTFISNSIEFDSGLERVQRGLTERKFVTYNSPLDFDLNSGYRDRSFAFRSILDADFNAHQYKVQDA